MADESRLVRIFSRYIRLRDANPWGYANCFTCGARCHWKVMECGHGVSRQHAATKFDERNNHAQCHDCNCKHAGRQQVYAANVDRIYGAGTWQELVELSRTVCKRTSFEIAELTEKYTAEVKRLKAEKYAYLQRQHDNEVRKVQRPKAGQCAGLVPPVVVERVRKQKPQLASVTVYNGKHGSQTTKPEIGMHLIKKRQGNYIVALCGERVYDKSEATTRRMSVECTECLKIIEAKASTKK